MSHFTVAVFTSEGGKSIEELLAPYQENNMGDCPKEYLKVRSYAQDGRECWFDSLEAAKAEFGDQFDPEETFEENPNRKWDWWEVGGRWSGLILTKDGVKVDSARLSDIHWDKMTADAKAKAQKIWDSNPEGIERYFADIHKDDTRESYVKRQSDFGTYAVITPDGVWHSKGEMGWFGCSSESEKEGQEWSDGFHGRFIKNADTALTLTIVDCHI